MIKGIISLHLIHYSEKVDDGSGIPSWNFSRGVSSVQLIGFQGDSDHEWANFLVKDENKSFSLNNLIFYRISLRFLAKMTSRS